MMPKTRVWWSVALVVTITGAACGKGETAPPVAKISVSLNKPSVPLGSPIDLTYRFDVEAGAKVSGDYRVFAHLIREDGTTIWSDDHDLPEGGRTSQWQPGQKIEYTRTRFIPTLSYLGPASLEVGLYKEDERLPLSGPNAADRESPERAYRVASIELLPKADTVPLIQVSGWYAPEFAADPTQDWQWTQKSAVVSLKNPKKDLMLYLEFDARSDLFSSQPQQVSIYCGDARVGGFAAASQSTKLERVPITAAQLGTGEMAVIRIEVDRTFVPAQLPGAGSDVRELGIRVFHTFVEPR